MRKHIPAQEHYFCDICGNEFEFTQASLQIVIKLITNKWRNRYQGTYDVCSRCEIEIDWEQWVKDSAGLKK
jgi:DNA-directed RNA polymerase subunit RPC12/RpoP